MGPVRKTALFVTRSLSAVGLFVIAVAALAALAATLAAAFGALPWLQLTLTFGETVYPQAGMVVQIMATALLVALLGYLPASIRVSLLEMSHRRFELTMNDIARAYHHCHSADRAGVFTLPSEFDGVRERLNYLRQHPDLAQCEAQVLEVAAQMSQQSRQLAETYSNEKVARAKEFLQQRQEEAAAQQVRIKDAHRTALELKRWTEQVETEEALVESQLARLREELAEALPQIGMELADHPRPSRKEFRPNGSENLDQLVPLNGMAAE